MTEPLLPGLREQLVAAADRQLASDGITAGDGRHRPWLRALAAAAVVLSVVAVGIGVIGDEPATADVEIRFVDGRIEVRLTDLEARPTVVERALDDAGIDATVSGVPVGPSRVGRFIRLASAETEGVEPIDLEGEAFTGFVVDEDHDQPVLLHLGRSAEDDEPYAVPSDAYAAGEPLSCLGVHGQRAGDLATALGDVGAGVRVQAWLEGSPAGPPEALDRIPDAYVDFIASDARAFSPTDVVISVTVDGRSPLVTPASPDAGACQE